jgi:hypothetical protein
MVDDVTQIEQLPPQSDAASGDAGLVEQIVDKPECCACQVHWRPPARG